MSELGASFLKKSGRAADGSWYFSTTREGKPLVQPYNIFSDCFATMAFGQLARTAQSAEYAEVAVGTFHKLLDRRENPKGQWNKEVAGTRPLKNFALPMILCNLSLEIEPLFDGRLVGEWYGYLNRRGEVLLPLLGGNGKAASTYPAGCTNAGKYWLLFRLVPSESSMNCLGTLL